MKIMTIFTRQHLKNDRGHTLLELFVVIAIIGVLAAIAIPQYGFFKKRAYDSASQSDIYNLYSSCRSYWSDNPDGSLCSLSEASSDSYGFNKSNGVTLTILNETKTSFLATSHHAQGLNTYQIGPEGYATIQ